MSNEIIRVQYAAKPETNVYQQAEGGRPINKILLGTWAGVVKDDGRERVRVITAGPDGWIRRNELRDNPGLKIFFVDVGQGDGMLVETLDKRLLIDGGPNTNLRRYLRGYQYSYILRKNERVRIDTVLVSHFDADHYNGLIALFNDEQFEFGTVYHNGIARFHNLKRERPAGYNTDLGKMDNDLLSTTFSDINDARNMLQAGGLQAMFRRFLEAVVNAHDQGRLDSLSRLTTQQATVPGYEKDKNLSIEVLGPVPKLVGGQVHWPWFGDSSHTRNGHSLVLKLNYSEGGQQGKTVLLGGDLNTEAEAYLIQHYGNSNPFMVDVAKSCHHGSSDFLVEYMDRVKPFATVISSGDNESYAHPRAEAIGCAGKYSRGERPKVFSTELARSINSAGDVLYGMINCRTDGKQIIMAQMKERRTGADIWDSYKI
ncbi:MAG: MBL fold metallo-hydrolase [Bacteroidales bacterium]|nr:MBL fold metallo-hydrolase [Bacteroidales bacterium]